MKRARLVMFHGHIRTSARLRGPMELLSSRVVLGIGVAAALVLRAPAIVNAQPESGTQTSSNADKQVAKKLVDEGIAAQNVKDYDKAIEFYKKAFALVSHPALLFNIGQAHRLAGRPDQAVPFYERYLALNPNGSESATAREILAMFYLNLALAQLDLGQLVEARENLEHALRHGEESLGAEQFRDAQKQFRKLERQLGQVHVTCQTKGAEVTLDGVRLFTGPGSYRGWTTAQAHELTAQKAGYPSDTRKFVLLSGDVQDVALELLPPSDARNLSRRWATWKPWAVVLAGGALVIPSGALHALSRKNFKDYDKLFVKLSCAYNAYYGCRPEEIPSQLNDRLNLARLQQTIAVGGYIIGGSLIATGLVLSYLNQSHQKERAVTIGGSVLITPEVSSDMFGLLVSVTR